MLLEENNYAGETKGHLVTGWATMMCSLPEGLFSTLYRHPILIISLLWLRTAGAIFWSQK